MSERKKDINKKIEVLVIIANDMKNDATDYDGKPFNGRTVAEYCARLGAGIAALANILKSELEVEQKKIDEVK